MKHSNKFYPGFFSLSSMGQYFCCWNSQCCCQMKVLRDHIWREILTPHLYKFFFSPRGQSKPQVWLHETLQEFKTIWIGLSLLHSTKSTHKPSENGVQLVHISGAGWLVPYKRNLFAVRNAWLTSPQVPLIKNLMSTIKIIFYQFIRSTWVVKLFVNSSLMVKVNDSNLAMGTQITQL